MPAQIAKGETFTDVTPGKSVTSTRLNNLMDQGYLLPGAVTEQTDISTSIASDDTLLMHDTSASALKKVQAQYLLTPEVITNKTDISTSLASDDLLLFSDTSASSALKKVQVQNLLVPQSITAKTDISSTVSQSDLVLLADVSDSNNLKKATVAGLHPSGSLLQTVSAEDAAVTTVTGSIPIDDTKPQSGEGTQVLSASITPTSSSNYLEIEAIVPYGASTSLTVQAIALFQDSGADALAATTASIGTNDSQGTLRLVHRMAAGTTSSTTFKVRIGTTGGSIYTCGNGSGTRNFGGVGFARLFVREVKA